jgi:hypothetical protein
MKQLSTDVCDNVLNFKKQLHFAHTSATYLICTSHETELMSASHLLMSSVYSVIKTPTKKNGEKSAHSLPPHYLHWGQHNSSPPPPTSPVDYITPRHTKWTSKQWTSASPRRKSHLDRNRGMPTPRKSTRHTNRIHTVSNIINPLKTKFV